MKGLFTHSTKKWHRLLIACAVFSFFTYTANAQVYGCYDYNGAWGLPVNTMYPACGQQTIACPSTGSIYWYPAGGVYYNFWCSGPGWGGNDITDYVWNGSTYVPYALSTSGYIQLAPAAGTHLLMVTNGTGCWPPWSGNSATITYQIAPPYTPGISQSPASGSHVCSGNGVTYTASGSGVGYFAYFQYEWNGTGSWSGSWLSTSSPATWGSCCPGNTLYVIATTNNGGCTANSSYVYATVDANTVAGTVTQTPSSGSHQCSGYNVGYTLTGYTGTINNWNYDWTVNSSGATAGWTNWGSGGSATINWTCGINGSYNELQVYATVQSGVCSALGSNVVYIVVDPTSVGGTITQTPSSGGHQCTGSNVAYTLSGYTGTINNWNYDWTVNSSGATQGWNNWSNGGNATQNWTCGINGSYNELQVNATVTSGVCPAATSNTVYVVIDPASSAGSFVTNPIYSCVNGTLYNGSGTALSGESITGYTGTINGWGWGTNTTTCSADNAGYPYSAGSANMNLNCCWPGVGSGTTDMIMVQVTSGVCASVQNCISVTENAMVAPSTASISPTGPVCAPTSGNITLSYTGGFSGNIPGGTLKWYSGSCGGTYVGSGQNLSITAPSATTTYYCAWVDPCGNLTTCASATFTVVPVPTLSSASYSICSGGTTTLSSSAAGTWVSNNTAAATVSGSTVTGTTAGGSATFTLTTSASPGCPYTMATPIVVTTLPAVSINAPTTFCSGATTTLSPSSGGTWVSNNTTAATVSGNTVTGATAGGSATFTFTSSTSPNCANTTSSSVVVTALPTVYGVTGGGTYCLGSGSVVGLANSQSGVNYQLYLNGTAVGSPVAGTGSSISFGSQSAVGTYTVKATTVTNSCQQAMSGSAIVTELSPNVTNNPGATGIGTNGATLNGTD